MNNETGAFNVEELKEEHKIVFQLDDVTKETESKAAELFSQLTEVLDKLKNFQDIVATLDYEKMNKIEIKNKIEEELKKVHASRDIVNDSMCLMQYQDINRQKVERVINVIRSLSQYLNYLFEGKIEDKHRTESAVHITGDSSDEELLTDEELEKLLSIINPN